MTDAAPDAALGEAAYAWVERAARLLRVEVEGLEHVPRGRALLVANHSFGWDVVFAMAAIRRATGRPIYALGEHLWWQVPGLGRLAAAMGTVDGSQENADRLLGEDHLVVVLPGGMREAVKPRELRYQLLWGNRYGFVRAAMRNRAPIVPLASVGADDLFDFVGNAQVRGRRFFGRLGRLGIPFPIPSHLVPHRTRFRFVLGEPIDPGPSEDAERPERLRRVRREVAGALHELIENELARRAGIPL